MTGKTQCAHTATIYWTMCDLHLLQLPTLFTVDYLLQPAESLKFKMFISSVGVQFNDQREEALDEDDLLGHRDVVDKESTSLLADIDNGTLNTDNVCL